MFEASPKLTNNGWKESDKMKRFLLAASTALLLSTSAYAGSNQCVGTVKTLPDWGAGNWAAIITDGIGCQFKVRSKVGRKILATCQNGSNCFIELELPKGDIDVLSPVQTIVQPKDVISIEALKPEGEGK
jgi:hypothetical protein